MDCVWSVRDMGLFAGNYARVLGWPHFAETPLPDCDTAYMVGMYDAPTYDFSLDSTKRARRRIIHWCGSDAFMLARPEMLPEATHIADSQRVYDELLNRGVKSVVIESPTVLHPEVTPLPDKPVIAVYLGSVPENYGATYVRFLQDVFPDVAWAVYQAGQYSTEEMHELFAASSIVLRLTSHDGSAVGVREFMEAGRHAITTHAMPYAKQVSLKDPVGVVAAIRAALKKSEPNYEAAAYYAAHNSDARFLEQFEEVRNG